MPSKSPQTSPTILQRVATGDESAVEDCLQRYGGLVWSLASRWLNNTADAEDAAQEIFVEIWKNAKSYDPCQAAESTFVTLIARRRLIDRIRRNSSAVDTLSISAKEFELPAEVTIEPVELADEANKALACVRRLSTEQRQVIELSIYRGFSHSHIAERLTMPLGTVKSFARRALLQLRECMNHAAWATTKGGAL
jgi:RNA polymerase sigma-70 factor (ECF subfamily)